MPDARLAMPQMLCTLRGVKVTDHPRNPEAARGRVFAWGQVELAGDSVLCFDADGMLKGRVPVPADQRRTLRDARRRAIAMASAAETLHVRVLFNLRANRRRGVLLGLMFTAMFGSLVFLALRDWRDGNFSGALFLLGFSFGMATLVAWLFVAPSWRSNLQRIRVHAGGVDADLADGRALIVSWADVERVRQSGFSVIIQSHQHGALRFLVEPSTPRAIMALQTYRPEDWPRARTVPEQIRILRWYGLIGSVVVGTVSWTLGLDAWRVLLGTLMPAGLVAMLYGLDWFVRFSTGRSRSKRLRGTRAMQSVKVEHS